MLPGSGRQGVVSQPGGMVGAAGGQEGLVTEADIGQTMLRKGLVSRMCIPWEMCPLSGSGCGLQGGYLSSACPTTHRCF